MTSDTRRPAAQAVIKSARYSAGARIKESLDFLFTEHHWEPLSVPRISNLTDGPVALERYAIEKPQGADYLNEITQRDVLLVDQIYLVLTNLFWSQQLRRFAEEAGELSNAGDVGSDLSNRRTKMETQITGIVLTEATRFATKFALDKIKEIFMLGGLPCPENDTAARISKHLTRVANWASTYNFLGLGTPKECDKETISLRFNSTPRRYRPTKFSGTQEELSEDDFLRNRYSVVLLGDPGAGKTTTLKRIALSILTKDTVSDADVYQFPLLLVLRELPRGKFICEEIADTFGLPYQKTLITTTKCEADRHSENTFSRADFDIKIEGMPIEDALADLLNATRALILVDGLDELEYAKKASVEREIESLNTCLTESKIILSCRSGDYNTNFHGFRVLEILPLNKTEIAEIAQIWLEEPEPFLQALEKTPYTDIVDRPLLLSFLLYLFNSEKELPEQPSLIYRKVVYRLLREWDDERRIKRISKYAHFDPDRKIDFLSELAYYLTYEIKGKSFTEKNFIEAYTSICSSFNLPNTEYKQVALEVETHSGIVVSSGISTFEFAHLSIQEFLCAVYISRSPYPDLLKRYLAEYPAPVAVACALSSNPSMFLVEMINRHLCEKFRDPYDRLHGEPNEKQLTFDLFGDNTAAALKSFLTRLNIENPFFKVDTRLGESVLCIFAFYYRRYSSDIDDLLSNFLEVSSVQHSLRLAVDNMKGIEPWLLTEKTAVFAIDTWFQSIYQNVAGPWPRDYRRAKVLPLVLFPAETMKRIWPGKLTSKVPQEIRERVKRTLSPTPFCFIENTNHEWNSNEVCSVCGFIKRAPRRIPRF